MKKLILFTFLIPIFVSSQINVNHTNLPNIGDTVITMSDYGSYNHGNSGANQFWDFSTFRGFTGNDVRVYRSVNHSISIKFSE